MRKNAKLMEGRSSRNNLCQSFIICRLGLFISPLPRTFINNSLIPFVGGLGQRGILECRNQKAVEIRQVLFQITAKRFPRGFIQNLTENAAMNIVETDKTRLDDLV